MMRLSDADAYEGVVRNVELVVGSSDLWLDGPVSDWAERAGDLGSWVGFLVDDMDAVYELLVAAGAEVDAPRTRGHGVREITVKVSEGHSWGFIEQLH